MADLLRLVLRFPSKDIQELKKEINTLAVFNTFAFASFSEL